MDIEDIIGPTPDPSTLELLVLIEGRVLGLRTLLQYLLINEIRRKPEAAMTRLDTLERLALKSLKQGIRMEKNHPYGELAIHIPLAAQAEVKTLLGGLREDLKDLAAGKG